MMLYDRDYAKLEQCESAELARLREKAKTLQSVPIGFFDEFKVLRHYLELFPNQYLDINELQDIKKLTSLLNDFIALIEHANERDILNYIRKKRAFFIIGSIVKNGYTFGHHGAFLFPEFPLGNSYKVDYLLVGRGSDGWHFVFVELESPTSATATVKSGDFGNTIRKGTRQISDWDGWLEENFTTLREVFEKYKGPESNSLPKEFTCLDTTRIHFVVVGGRRVEFNDKTYRERRKSIQNKKTEILHYDNLVDRARAVIGSTTY